MAGGIVEKQSEVYTERSRSNAWGRHRHPNTWDYLVMNPFGMGGTHSRMLSPDNYVQSPNSTQSFNRYSYCWNNPLKYTDPSGEIVGTIFTSVWDFGATILTKGGIDPWNTKENRQQSWAEFDPSMRGTKTNNAWRIDKGMFQTDSDPSKNWVQKGWQIVSRFTWEAPQSGLGNILSHIRNISGNVDNVDYWGGATVVNDGNDYNESGWGVTLGSYINSQNMEASPEDPLFRHEYGHVLQSKIAGPTYLAGIGLPSLVGSALELSFGRNFHNHNYEWYETNANQLAFKYFDKYEKEALTKRPWNFDEYPIRYRPTLFWALGNPLFSPWTFIYGLTLQKP